MSSSEEKILKLTEIPAFKGKNTQPRTTPVNEQKYDSKSFVTPTQPNLSKFDNISPLGEDQKPMSITDNPFLVRHDHRGTSYQILGKPSSKSSEITPKSQVLGLHSPESSVQRRGSVFSTISVPTFSNGDTKQSMASSRRRHSKTKSFSFSMYDLTPKISRSSTLRDEESDPSLNKRKTNKFIQWFRKK
ncbi:uncharacterized protein CANTADRAFT_8110 [Suhomyces tanzawaensis NRRL Y-17324]|uniref:Uncharacterized protein n=1 Tax=Suhomyces tanzawaensis NRRL Y-17324 TaxID=984487 RepID=A0A1E4SDU5_9ASCO|nr:uncharacterized protein CANTADRAFT_8110 [Suhomyces tanzawaensis NRRL Y-17324]ODV77675.1 hypothetical protein CANTADRAFT_8110 [Suhomyces tanzawaensis NRRL Y-17324]